MMDPFEDITRQCQISSSQEQILRDLILSSIHSTQEEDCLNIISSNEQQDEEEEEEEPNAAHPYHRLVSPPTPIIICSPPDTNEEQQLSPPHVRRNSPETTERTEPMEKDPLLWEPPNARRNSPDTRTCFDGGKGAQQSEPTKTKPPELEKDPAVWKRTSSRCSTLNEKPLTETSPGLLDTSMDVEFGGERRLKDLGVLEEKEGDNAENTKKLKQGSSFESGICEEADDSSAVGVSWVFERLAGRVSGEGNAGKSVGSVRKSPATSVNAGGLQKLPPSIRGRSKEKEGTSSARVNKALEKSILANLIEVATAFSKERDWETGDVDVLQAAEQAGYTFPRPRWWPPEDEL